MDGGSACLRNEFTGTEQHGRGMQWLLHCAVSYSSEAERSISHNGAIGFRECRSGCGVSIYNPAGSDVQVCGQSTVSVCLVCVWCSPSPSLCPPQTPPWSPRLPPGPPGSWWMQVVLPQLRQSSSSSPGLSPISIGIKRPRRKTQDAWRCIRA